MPLCEHWATIEDFATLFQYLWYRDFPIDNKKVTGAKRKDWNIHTGVVMRNIADLISFTARFESEGRIDGILRSIDSEIAIEWEWEDITVLLRKKTGNEIEKLKKQPEKASKTRPRNYAVLLSYTLTPTTELDNTIYKPILEKWHGTKWPLLLILITAIKSKTIAKREFENLRFIQFDCDSNSYREFRTVPACPWNVLGTRWYLNR